MVMYEKAYVLTDTNVNASAHASHCEWIVIHPWESITHNNWGWIM